MTTDASLASKASLAVGSGVRRDSLRFMATPPRGDASRMLAGQQDAEDVEVLIRRLGEYALVSVAGELRVRVPRRNWTLWLNRRDPVLPPYLLSPLRVTKNALGLWLEISDYVAPMLVTEALLARLLDVLSD